MRQTRTFAMPAAEADVTGRVFLEARAGEAPFIHGYKMDMHVLVSATFGADGDAINNLFLLQGAPKAPVVPVIVGDTVFDGMVKHRGNIGALAYVSTILLNTAVGHINHEANVSSGWVPCGFEVPGLWGVLMSGIEVTDTPVTKGIVTVSFEWVSKSAQQMAALYTMWGIDAVDATEREATGEIDFSRGVGDALPPNIIG